MARIIPNAKSWIGFSTTIMATPIVASAAVIAGATTTNLTCLVSSLNASAQGNAIPTPDLCSLFEKSIIGTSTATFTVDMYRDDVPVTGDLGWEKLTRGTRGTFFISRFGGTAAAGMPKLGDKVEVWPVEVISRAAGPLSSNTPQTFTVTCAVYQQPAEDQVVVA